MFGQLRLQLRGLKRRALLEINQPTNFGKMDLIHLISRRLNLVNYLELCTPTTGNYYGEIKRWRFNTARRLMYNCPKGFDDGLPIDFKILGFDIGNAVEKLKADPNKVDICLVDGWHTYDCAIRDLTCAYELLADGGVLVVHDCLPPTEVMASPVWISRFVVRRRLQSVFGFCSCSQRFGLLHCELGLRVRHYCEKSCRAPVSIQ